MGFRFISLLLLLAAETIWLRLRFDVAVIRDAAGWWSGLLTGPSNVAQIAIAFAAAVFLIGAPRMRRIYGDLVRAAADDPRWLIFLLLHLGAFAGVYASASFLAAVDHDTVHQTPAIVGTVCSYVALGFWLAAIAPIRFWRDLFSREWVSLIIAGCVGAAALLAGKLTQHSWTLLTEWTFALVERILRAVYPQIVSEPGARIIGTPQFKVQVSHVCSGVEGIGLICVFLTVFFITFRRRLRFPQAWLLWPIGVVGIWGFNAVRIAVLVMIGNNYSPGVAIRGFHSQAGWLFFNLVALSLMAGALRSSFFAVREASAAETPRTSALGAYLVPFLTLMVMNMLVAAFSDGFEQLYPAKVVVTAIVLWNYRVVLQKLEWSWSWSAIFCGAFVFLLWLAIATNDEIASSDLGTDLAELSPLWRAVWIAFRVAGATLTVPLVEELAFRGYLLRRFVSLNFTEVEYQRTPWWAMIISSLMFGLMHGRWFAGTLAGVAYALAARRRGRLCDAVLAHSLTNALIAADVLLTGAWWLW